MRSVMVTALALLGSSVAVPFAASGAATLQVAPQEDPADAAWRAGNTERALALYLERLDADPNDGLALHRVGMIRAWAGAYDEALELIDRLLALQPDNLDARVDRARVVAWKGDVARAIEDVDAVLRERPGYPAALEARATFQAWAGRYEASLSTYEALLSASPDNLAARRQQAQVLSWASRFDASRAAYDSLLALDPEDVEARLGLARVLAFSGDTRGAAAAYRRVLEGHPGHLRALQGLGQALSWEGRLVEGEEVLRRAVATDSTDVAGLTGLAQNLRWQGRNAAALEVLRRAQELAPSDGDVREQRRWVDVALAPQLRPTVVLERDSDENRMLTTAVMASWNPVPRLRLRADAYRRSLEQVALSRSARGLTVSASWQAEPGWTLSAGVGASESDVAGASAVTAWNAGVGSPGRHPLVGSLTVSSYALDASALLVERGVRLTEVSATGRLTLSPRWRVDVAAGRGSYEGRETNHRDQLSVAVAGTVDRGWTLGAGARAFGFDEDLTDGYFDPDFYGIAEVSARWLWEPGARWSFLAEVAPGMQQIGQDGDPSGALRASGRVTLRLGAGRELSVAGGYSSTGLQSFASGASDYRYTAVIVGGSWVF